MTDLAAVVTAPFPEVVEAVSESLAAQGFGVLTHIDVRDVMQRKLAAELEDYLILGACNPTLAHAALEVDRHVGVLLPCNVVVRADAGHPGRVLVEAVDPQDMVAMTGKAELQPVADEAARRLGEAVGEVAARFGG